MKSIVKFLVIILMLGVVMSSCEAVADKVLKNEVSDKFLYFVAGFDDAAENTDVLFTVGFDKTEKKIFVAQIPRDTYYNFGASQNKINQVFASLRASGMNKYDAMKRTSDAVSDLFGAEFDGFLGVTTESFRKIVDSLGGVDIHLNSELQIDFDEGDKILLKEGENHIDGITAEKLVRYRSGYIRGDLARIDIQKIFLNSLFSKLATGISLSTMISIVKTVGDDIVTDLDLGEIANFAVSNINMTQDATSMFVTVPGEPIQDANGLSYYVINRKSAAEIAKRYMFSTREFDKKFLCLKENDAGFANIYEDDSIFPKEFTSDNISEIHISKG